MSETAASRPPHHPTTGVEGSPRVGRTPSIAHAGGERPMTRWRPSE